VIFAVFDVKVVEHVLEKN